MLSGPVLPESRERFRVGTYSFSFSSADYNNYSHYFSIAKINLCPISKLTFMFPSQEAQGVGVEFLLDGGLSGEVLRGLIERAEK